MDISFYQMGDVYQKSVLLKEWSTEPTSDDANSMRLTQDMGGQGSTGGAKDTDPPQFKDSMMFAPTDLSNSQKKELLMRFLSVEIDNGTWNNKTKKIFGELLDHLMGLKIKED